MTTKTGPEDFFGIESEDHVPQFVTAFGTVRYDPPAPEPPKWNRKGKGKEIKSGPREKRKVESYDENFGEAIGERFDAEAPTRESPKLTSVGGPKFATVGRPEAPARGGPKFASVGGFEARAARGPKLAAVGDSISNKEKFVDPFLREGEIPDPLAPANAVELAKQIRENHKQEELQELAEKDKDGSLQNLRKIWDNIPQFYRMNTDEIVEYLKQQIIFDDGKMKTKTEIFEPFETLRRPRGRIFAFVERSPIILIFGGFLEGGRGDLLALNKPPGLPMHGGPKVTISLARTFPKLASALKCERLFLLHRLDQNSTGVVLLCRSTETLREIRQMFLDRRVIKKYWCLTKGVPMPEEGIIDIPLTYQRVGGRFKMVPCPRKTAENGMKNFASASRNLPAENEMRRITSASRTLPAKTEYKVLDVQTKCAFVECILHTGFKHQIRAHLGFGMDTPIIGDHKYSDYLRYVPQRLPGEVLHRLGIRSQKSRDVPFCLHAREIQLPEFRNNQNLFIRAPLPKHMVYLMKTLKFAIPK